MTCFLTFLTLLTFLTVWPEWHSFSVRIVRFSDISDCACGEKSNFLSLLSADACLLRAREQICQKTPTMIQRALLAPEREVA